MLDRILSYLAEGPPAPMPHPDSIATRRDIAAAALMVEAARLDRHFDDVERRAIARIVTQHFKLTPEEAQELVAVAEKSERRNYDPWAFIQAVKRGFSEEERKDLLQALWEVAYSDGTLNKFEVHLVNHVCEEFGLSRDDCEAARQAAERAAAA